jgi:glycosyltransferase involved in cell wall biosynthesis
MDKIKELISLKLTPPKLKNGLVRKTQQLQIIDIQNTTFENDSLVSQNNDTQVTLKFSSPAKYLKIVTNISSEDKNAQTQLFYRVDDENFTEENSIRLGTNETNIQYIVSASPISHIRLDAISTNGNFDINYFEVIKISKSEYKLAQRLNTVKKIRAKIKQDSSLIKKFISSVKHNGLKQSILKVKAQLHKSEIEEKYDIKYTYIEPNLTTEIKKEMNNFLQKPLISIIMPVYNVDPKWLDLAIKSIENQWYESWELCIADDKSTNKKTIDYLKSINNPKIKVKILEKNLNISGASNAALELTSGEFIALMDNDDEITPDALYEVVKAINETNAEFIYSDEDKLEMNGDFSDPHFKPNFAPDLFLSQNYISHLGVVKKSLIEKVRGWEIGLEGAQDYDLYLKIFEHTNKIYHIPKVLYHWRKIPGSTASEFSDKSYAQEAGRKSIENTIKRRNLKAKVLNGKYPGTYKVDYIIEGKPLVSIVIPFKDKPELLKMCIDSISEKSTYTNFEIIGISNNSQEKEVFDLMKYYETKDKRIKFYEYNVPFNYSQINNFAVNNYVNGKHIILLNNDIEIITSNWIEEMLMHSQRQEIGCVGVKLYYPNDTIQHAGITIGVLKLAGHNFKHLDKNVSAYFGRESVIYNVSAVTAACLMVKTNIFKELNGLNETDLKVAFNDVDFCLRVQEKGYKNVFTPYCEAYHHESISRGTEDNSEKIARFNAEVDYMQKRHKDILLDGDPYYNPNLTLDREDFSLR